MCWQLLYERSLYTNLWRQNLNDKNLNRISWHFFFAPPWAAPKKHSTQALSTMDLYGKPLLYTSCLGKKKPTYFISSPVELRYIWVELALLSRDLTATALPADLGRQSCHHQSIDCPTSPRIHLSRSQQMHQLWPEHHSHISTDLGLQSCHRRLLDGPM